MFHSSGIVRPDQPWSTTMSVNTDIVFAEHVTLRMSLDVEGYEVPYGLSDFYFAWYYYYYGEKLKGDSRFADFDDYGGGRFTNGRTIYDWLTDPHPKRGDIQVELTSSQGTTCILCTLNQNLELTTIHSIRLLDLQVVYVLPQSQCYKRKSEASKELKPTD